MSSECFIAAERLLGSF